eukprot:1160114-Pelagomonas_calceolata.AAC.4
MPGSQTTPDTLMRSVLVPTLADLCLVPRHARRQDQQGSRQQVAHCAGQVLHGALAGRARAAS